MPWPPASPSNQSKEQTTAAVANLWERFKSTNLKRVEVLEQIVMTLFEGALSEEQRQQAERDAHKLAGSVGTFGFLKGSQLAREMEHLFQSGVHLSQDDVRHLSELVVALRQELEQRAPERRMLELEPKDERPRLLLIDTEAELSERLMMEATPRGLRAEAVMGVAATKHAISCERPDVVLLNLSVAGAANDRLRLLTELATQAPPIPVLVLTTQDTFTDRISVVKAGGYGILQKPMSPARIMAAVVQTVQQVRMAGARVLAVDNDPQVLTTLRAVLEPQEIQLTTLDDPLRFWDVLSETSPDLLVLNVEMPRVSGIELCRVVRSAARWQSLPVLCLSASTDTGTIQRLFAAGADDYISKPISGAEVVTRITNRLERTRLLRHMAETDAQTGLPNQTKSTQTLNQLLHLAGRHKQPFCVAVLDLDHLKELNSQHGYAVGDRVLRGVGDLLFRSFRSEDVVSHWGGGEFVLGLYGLSRDGSIRRLTDVLRTLLQEGCPGPDGVSVSISFSGGVAEFPLDGADFQSLYRAAAATLSQAKVTGRRVLPVGWRPNLQQEIENVDVAVVDDDETLAGLLFHALQTRGYSSCWLQDGPTALARLSGEAPTLKARLVLLDVDLPGLDGLAVLRHLAHGGILRRSRVIMLTFRSVETEVVAALELGAVDHVAKPFSLPVLMQRIQRTLQE
jgi:diguanylate cyclase (GGDEF)-like protein